MAKIAESRQGQSLTTPYKEAAFGAAFRASLAISNQQGIRQHPYWHFDLNAGSGWNEVPDCPGSPLIFQRAALEVDRPVHAYFVDHNAEHIAALNERLFAGDLISTWMANRGGCADHLHMQALHADNRAFIHQAGELIERSERNPECAVGTIVSDPNGPGKRNFPADELHWFAGRYPRIDIVLNFNVGAYNMMLQFKQKRGRKCWDELPTIPELLASLNRQHWLVRPPDFTGKAMNFIVLVGRNIKSGANRHVGFVDVCSPQGRHCITQFTKLDVGQLLFDFPDLTINEVA